MSLCDLKGALKYNIIIMIITIIIIIMKTEEKQPPDWDQHNV